MSDYILVTGELKHHGVKGMKWGVRRYQKKDGSLTRRGKKHREKAIKGLIDSRDQALVDAKKFKEAAEINKEAFSRHKRIDKKIGEENSWATQHLRSTYKLYGRQYVNNMLHAEIYSKYIDAYSKDTIKIGEDYVVTNLKIGKVNLTDTGRSKESDIVNQVQSDFEKRYRKEIKEYS